MAARCPTASSRSSPPAKPCRQPTPPPASRRSAARRPPISAAARPARCRSSIRPASTRRLPMPRSASAKITVASPLGPLTVAERDGAIVALDWGTASAGDRTTLLLTAAQQLDAYFYCELRAFDLPLA